MHRGLIVLLLLWPAAALAADLWPASPAALPASAVPAGLPSLSAQTCNACHGAIHDGWAGSAHAFAGKDPIWRAGAALLGDPPLCNECHLPMIEQRAVLPDGPPALSTGRGAANPAWSPTLAQEGVTCAACHVRDGKIIGPRPLLAGDAPHPVEVRPELGTVQACAACHQSSLAGAEGRPWLDTVGEWERSPFGQAGIGCKDCHMTRTAGPIAGNRFAAFASHGGAFPRDPTALARALTVDVQLRAARLARSEVLRATATLANTGAGHAFPSGDPSHRVEVRWTVLDAGAKGAGEARSDWLVREVSSESPFRELKDQRLPAGGTKSFDFQWEPGKKSAAGLYTVRLEVIWWAVSPDAAKAAGLAVDLVSVPFVRQDLMVRVD